MEGDLASCWELMPRVACDPNRQRPVSESAELAIDPPIGLQRDKVLRRIEPARRADGRHEVGVAGHEDCPDWGCGCAQRWTALEAASRITEQ